MLTLYLSPGASSMAPHIALHETGARFEIRSLSFAKKEHRDPEFLAINPEGKVPTLVVDGHALTEVAGCLFYIAKRFADAGLLPANDIEVEAHAVSWMSFIAATLHPARSDFPNLWAHHDRMMQRSAAQETIAIEQVIGYELPA